MCLYIPFILLTFASLGAAAFNVHNWCTSDVYIWQSNNGDCDKGPNGLCAYEAGSAPWTIAAGDILPLDFIANGFGTSVKISKTVVDNAGILQYEYCMGNGDIYWDLSDLDGRGASLVGTPFANDNVKISPVGAGAGTGNCVPIACPAGQVCADAYLLPDETKTMYCPQTVQTWWLDLCEPDGNFRKRGGSFNA